MVEHALWWEHATTFITAFGAARLIARRTASTCSGEIALVPTQFSMSTKHIARLARIFCVICCFIGLS
jgi:hypothetical protein